MPRVHCPACNHLHTIGSTRYGTRVVCEGCGDPFIPRRPGPGTWVWLAVIGAAVLVGCAGVGLVGYAVVGRTAAMAFAGPTPEREGEQWGQTQLRDHLERRGLDVELTQDARGFWLADRPETFGIDVVFTRPSGKRETRSVNVVRFPTAAEARDAVAKGLRVRTGDPPPKDVRREQCEPEAFAWGRFLFLAGDDAAMAEIRKALGAH